MKGRVSNNLFPMSGTVPQISLEIREVFAERRKEASNELRALITMGRRHYTTIINKPLTS
jgi:hypothetical protein